MEISETGVVGPDLSMSYYRPRKYNAHILHLLLLKVRTRAFDLAGIFFAVLYGLPSLLYPLGADQSLFFYMGRLWFSGGLPYLDAVDQKPPGIYALYGIATAVLGPYPWAIHAFELAGVLATGWCISRIVMRQSPGSDGVLGLSCVITSVVYFTCFDYWSTGQVEFWQSLFSLASFAVVIRSERHDRSAVMGGALAGLATLFKPSLPLFLVFLTCALRAARAPAAPRSRALAGLRACALYGASAAAVIALALLPFALKDGGLEAMYTCVFVYNRAYMKEWTESFDINWSRISPCVIAVYTLTIAAFGKAVSERRTRDVGIGFACVGLLVLAAATVFVQRKFFTYHWVVVSPFLSLIATWTLVELASSVRGATIATVLSAVLFVAAGTFSWQGYHEIYSHHVKATWRYLRGETSRTTFTNAFIGPFGNEQTGLWKIAELIRKRARPDDTLCVRGYMPTLYVLSGLRCPSRFPWEQHMGMVWQPPISLYPLGDIRATWIIQHRDALAAHRPIFLVTFEGWAFDRYQRWKDSYREIAIVEGHVLLQRDRAQP